MPPQEQHVQRPTPKPLEGDAVLTVGAGTTVWLLVGLVLIPFHHKLNQHGHLWWIAAAFIGAGLGLIGLLVIVRRNRRHTGRRTALADSTSAGSLR